MSDYLTSEAVRTGFLLAHKQLQTNLDLLNHINVFPIADKDTGFNMEQSMKAVAERLPQSGAPVALFENASETLLQKGHGNSGTILTLFFNGLANRLSTTEKIGAGDLVAGVKNGADNAYGGISNPMPGTILSVSKAAAEEGEKVLTLAPDAGVGEVMQKMADAAYRILPTTASANPTLEKFGVIDSGATGFCMILDAFAIAFSGAETTERNYEELAKGNVAEEHEVSGYQYCAEFVVRRPKKGYDSILRAELERLGDCIIPVTDDKNLKVHIHTDRPEAVFFIASLCGSLQMTKVDDMALQSKSASEVKVFLCQTKLTADGVSSIGHEHVFCLADGEETALRKQIADLKQSGAAVCLYTVKKQPASVEKDLPKIRYFSDDDVLLSFLFSGEDDAD